LTLKGTGVKATGLKGTGFSPYINHPLKIGALAPERFFLAPRE